MAPSLLDAGTASRLAVNEIAVMVLADVLSPEVFNHGRLMTSPTLVYDLNREVLFYRFALVKNHENFGYVDMAASAAFTNPLLSVTYGQSWKPFELIKKASQFVKDKGVKSEDARFVAFSYPRLAVQFLLSGGETITVDGVSGNEIHLDSSFAISDLNNGDIAQSYLDSITSTRKKQNASLFNQHLEAWKKALSPNIDLHPTGSTSDDNLLIDSKEFGRDLKINFKELYRKNQVGYGHADTDHRPCFESRTKDKYGSYWGACIQMLLQFYRYTYDQELIESYLNPFSPQNKQWPVKTPEKLLSNSINKLSRGALVSTLVKNPSFEDFEKELKENRPILAFTSNNNCRVVIGTLHNLFLPGQPIDYLLVNDPTNSSATIQQWESFESQNYTYLITGRLKTIWDK
jgi:hypothetical protein